MYIQLNKIKENNKIVFYQFSIKEWRLETDINEYALKTLYGYCLFHKETEEFELDKEKTDPYFLENTHASILVMGKLMKSNKEKIFPDFLEIATG